MLSSSGSLFLQVQSELKNGGNPNWYNNQQGGSTALHVACKSEAANSENLVKALLDGGAAPEVLTLTVRA